MKQEIKILYIEHLRKEAELVEKKMSEINTPVETVLIYTKEDLVTALKRISPDLVLAENYFSTFSTEETLEIVKKNILNIPFFLVSAVVSGQHIQEIINDAVRGHIPTNRLDLLPEAIFTSPGKSNVVIERLKLTNGLLQADTEKNIPGSVTNETSLPVESMYDLSMLEEMDDNEYLADIITIFLTESPKELSEIRKAYISRDADKINKQAHKFKSSTGLIQANQLCDVLAQVEKITKAGTVNDAVLKLIETAQDQYNKIEASLKKRLAEIKQKA